MVPSSMSWKIIFHVLIHAHTHISFIHAKAFENVSISIHKTSNSLTVEPDASHWHHRHIFGIQANWMDGFRIQSDSEVA